MTEATDEEVVQFKALLGILGAAIGGETIQKLLDLSPKLLARLERVERELLAMQCGAQEARSLNKQPG